MSMLAGDLWVLSSYVIYCAGAAREMRRLDQPVSSPLPPLPHAASTTRPPCRSWRHPGLKPPRNNRRHHPRMPCSVQQRSATAW